MIHSTSHGYRYRKDCDTALLNLVNLQEEVQQRGGGCCISTWDMRKAFDSVHPDFVRIALQRMGLNNSHTDYYVRLNSAGRIIVRSPYAQHHIATYGYRLLNHITDAQSQWTRVLYGRQRHWTRRCNKRDYLAARWSATKR